MGSKRSSKNESESQTSFRGSTHQIVPKHLRSQSLDRLLQKLRAGDSKQEDKLADIMSAIGEFGTFQRRLVALTFIPNILMAFFLHVDSFVFTDQQPYCNTNWILAFYPNMTVNEQLHRTLPTNPKGDFITCLMFIPELNNTKTLPAPSINNTQPCEDGWIYPKADRRSLKNEFDLVCGKESRVDRVQTMLLSGVLIGSIIFGISSDRLGRYPTVLMSLLGLMVFGFGTAFVTTFHQYLFFRFCVCQALSGYTISCLSLVSEWLGDHHLMHAIILEFCFFSVGSVFLSGLAHMLHHWRLLFLIGGAPVFLLISYIWFLPESPRWLMVRGKVEEAKKVLRQAALMNEMVIPDSLLKKLQPRKRARGSLLDFYNSSYLRKVILVLLCAWFAVSFNYFILVLKMSHLGVNVYLRHLVTGLMKVPAHLCCIILLEKVGRRLTLGVMFMQGCLLSLLLLLLPTELKTTLLLLLLSGQLLQASTITVFFIYSTELLPTVIRTTGLGLIMLAFATGAISALMLINLMGSLLPIFLCCCFSFLALSLCCMMPDVQDQPLYDLLKHLPKQRWSTVSIDSEENTIDDMSEEVVKNTFINATMWRFSQGTLIDSTASPKEEGT